MSSEKAETKEKSGKEKSIELNVRLVNKIHVINYALIKDEL